MIRIVLILSIAILCYSCINDEQWYDMNNNELPEKAKPSDVFIINEGNFMYDNASLSYYKPDTMQVYNHVFYTKNEVPLGDVAQSMIIRDSLGYIVINNSGKVYVININTFEYVGKITGLTSPRYMHFVSDNKAYISDLYAKSVWIVNPITYEVTGSINVNNNDPMFYQHPTEQMVQYENFVFTNCWSYDNKILVIDTDTDQVVDSIEVIKQPNSMVMDKNQFIWVLCDGGFDGNPYGYEQPGLIKIEAKTRCIVDTFLFNLDDHPRDLCINGTADTLYYINNHIYQKAVETESSPELWLVSPYENALSGGYYSLGIDPNNSDVYLGDAIDHVQRGIVYRYSSQGTSLDTLQVGITPNAFCFIK